MERSIVHFTFIFVFYPSSDYCSTLPLSGTVRYPMNHPKQFLEHSCNLGLMQGYSTAALQASCTIPQTPFFLLIKIDGLVTGVPSGDEISCQFQGGEFPTKLNLWEQSRVTVLLLTFRDINSLPAGLSHNLEYGSPGCYTSSYSGIAKY